MSPRFLLNYGKKCKLNKKKLSALLCIIVGHMRVESAIPALAPIL